MGNGHGNLRDGEHLGDVREAQGQRSSCLRLKEIDPAELGVAFAQLLQRGLGLGLEAFAGLDQGLERAQVFLQLGVLLTAGGVEALDKLSVRQAKKALDAEDDALPAAMTNLLGKPLEGFERFGSGGLYCSRGV